jgi:ketosteroid isomerase-like protein
MPNSFQLELRDIAIHAAADVALAHYLCHFAPTPADHPCGQTWMRVTEGYRRTATGWKVIHSHVSVPFNPMNNQTWFIRDPDVADLPDYGQPCQ